MNFDQFVEELNPDTARSVLGASIRVSNSRSALICNEFEDVDAARRHAGAIKDYVLDHLVELLPSFEARCKDHGIVVHWAKDANSARNVILGICGNGGEKQIVVKGKSMASEEIHLNESLESHGHQVIETDLGEFVVQIDQDKPSHIVAPIIHKNRFDVSRSFHRTGLGPETVDPNELAEQARQHLRQKFQQATIGISGVNFACVDTGKIVIVENEGNNRLSTTVPKKHIAIMGIEKLLPREADLPLFLRLLATSATGQRVTVYTHFIMGPRNKASVDGPDEVHLILLDNGRSRVVSSELRSILRCIRCGACLNHCPVYRHSSGHAYNHVYCGPVGAVLAPALEGLEEFGALAKASTLCGECEEVCPVAIPIPELLLKVRRDYDDRAGATWKCFAQMATNNKRWRVSLTMLPLVSNIPNPWSSKKEVPRRQGRNFRTWFNER